MVYCNACGTEVPEGARFCQNCGAALAPAAGATPAPIDAIPFPPSQPTAFSPPPVYLPPPYPVVPGYAAPPARSGKAVAGFWLGIASIACCILSWIGIIVGVVGLIFSLIGLSDARRLAATTGESPMRYGYRHAVIGLVCAVIGILLSIAFLIYLLNNLDKYGIKITR